MLATERRGAVAQPGAEIAGGTGDMDGDGMEDGDGDVVAGVGVLDLDLLAGGGRLADAPVGLADGNAAQVDGEHVSCRPSVRGAFAGETPALPGGAGGGWCLAMVGGALTGLAARLPAGRRRSQGRDAGGGAGRLRVGC